MKIKVLFFVSTLETGGPTSVIFNIIRYLDADKFTPVILTLSPEPAKSQKIDFENLGVHVYQLNESRISWIASRGEKLKKIIKEIGPDVIHSHSVRPDVASAKYLKGYKRMATIHANLFRAYKGTYGGVIAAWFTHWQLDAMKKIDQTVACSKWVHTLYKRKIKGLALIQNGIDHERFHLRDQEQKRELRKKFGLPLKKRIFISAGGLTTLKDPETIMKAFKSLEDKHSVLVILGDGPVRSVVEEYASANPDILYKGFTKQVDQYYGAADYFISASHSEGLPNSVMEALASGLPVILSDITPHREILEINADAGMLFHCKNELELSDRMKELLKKDITQLQRSAINIIDTTLNARSMSQKYQEVYMGLARNSRSN